jgi:hypothetical protein
MKAIVVESLKNQRDIFVDVPVTNKLNSGEKEIRRMGGGK